MMLQVMEDEARWNFKSKSSPYSYSSITSFLFSWDVLSPSTSLCCFRWEQVVDLTYSLRLGAKPRPMEQDEAAVEKLRYELFPGFFYGGGQAPVSCDCPDSSLMQTGERRGKRGSSA